MLAPFGGRIAVIEESEHEMRSLVEVWSVVGLFQ